MLENELIRHEGEQLRNQLNISNARYNPNSLKAANHFIVYSRCKQCINIIYTIKLEKKPESDDVVLKVEKSGEHDFSLHINKRHVKGTKREELAKELKIFQGGSAKAYIETEIGKNSLISPPSQDVLRQCLNVIFFLLFFL